MENEVFKAAFNASVKYLSYRQRTENEVVEYLRKKEYEENIIPKVLNRLREVNYIDDSKYTINYINTAIAKQDKGIDLIKRDLFKKGINEEIILQHIHLYSIEKELAHAINMSISYFLLKKEYPLNQIKDKIYNKLLRKGFSSESIKAALRHIEQDEKIRRIIEEQQEQYEEQVMSLTKKYYEKYSKKETNKYKVKEKICAQLIRKGYDYHLIEMAIDKILGN